MTNWTGRSHSIRFRLLSAGPPPESADRRPGFRLPLDDAAPSTHKRSVLAALQRASLPPSRTRRTVKVTIVAIPRWDRGSSNPGAGPLPQFPLDDASDSVGIPYQSLSAPRTGLTADQEITILRSRSHIRVVVGNASQIDLLVQEVRAKGGAGRVIVGWPLSLSLRISHACCCYQASNKS